MVKIPRTRFFPLLPTLFAQLIRFKPEAFGELSLIPHRSYESSCYIFSFSVRRFLQYSDLQHNPFYEPGVPVPGSNYPGTRTRF